MFMADSAWDGRLAVFDLRNQSNFSLVLNSPHEAGGYHGPIALLSLPSPAYPAIFAAVEDAVIRADFQQTTFQTDTIPPTSVINLSGSPRGVLPSPTTPIFLWQKPFRSITAADVRHEASTWWDRRWTSFIVEMMLKNTARLSTISSSRLIQYSCIFNLFLVIISIYH